MKKQVDKIKPEKPLNVVPGDDAPLSELLKPLSAKTEARRAKWTDGIGSNPGGRWDGRHLKDD